MTSPSKRSVGEITYPVGKVRCTCGWTGQSWAVLAAMTVGRVVCHEVIEAPDA